MKKLVFMFVAMAAMSFASCGGNAQGEAVEAAVDSVAEAVEEVVAPVDSAVAETAEVVDSVVAEVAE
ncbi:MAG: hypothetical protein IKH95_07640 [Bacteroidaceae bacterium]|jgi:hypothetical protein|nr:hypothetical protein [Bacteroidaceae bacterium]